MDSYTLREVAELLGISKRTLQRRLMEGAFPNRFLSPGRYGLETRIPAEDVEFVMHELRRHGQEPLSPRRAISVRPRPSVAQTVVPDSLDSSYVPAYEPDHISSAPAGPASVTTQDLDRVKEAMLGVVREEREMFLAAVRSALTVRDREIGGLKDELQKLRSGMEGVRSSVERLSRQMRAQQEAELDAEAWLEVLAPAPATPVDVESILHELGELESMLGVLDDN